LASFLAYSIAAAAIHFLRPTTGYLSQIYGFVLVIPIGVLAVSVSSAFVQLNVKGGRFKRLAVMAILQATTTVVAQVTLGLLHVEHGLIIGTIFGSVLSGVVLGTLLGRDDRFSGFRSAIAPRHLMAVAREYANFPRYALAADVLNVLVQQFAPVFVLALFSPTVAGLYAFAVRMVRVPLIVVSTAVSIVLRKEAVDHLNREESLTSLFTPVVWRLFLVGLIPFLMILLFGDSLFALVFGPQWAEAGRVVQILSPGILLEFVAFPLGALFIVTNSQRYTFVIQATGLVALLLALFIGKQLLNDFISTCYLLSAVMVGVNLWSLVLAHRVASRTAPHRPRTPWPVPASADPAGLADAGAAQAGIGQT
jgi:O-antigen/teichoic acid export membrane protein